MMRIILVLTLLCISSLGYGQKDERISTIDFVEIVDGNKEEAVFYYQNNWRVLRDIALTKGYIHSYQLLDAPLSEGGPFELILITTYSNEEEYALREEHFAEIIAESGPLKLKNDKQPGEFRKTLFSKEMVRHIK